MAFPGIMAIRRDVKFATKENKLVLSGNGALKKTWTF